MQAPPCISSGVDPGEHHVREEGVDVISAEVAASVRQPRDCVAVGQQLGRYLLDALLGGKKSNLKVIIVFVLGSINLILKDTFHPTPWFLVQYIVKRGPFNYLTLSDSSVLLRLEELPKRQAVVGVLRQY